MHIQERSVVIQHAVTPQHCGAERLLHSPVLLYGYGVYTAW